MDRKKQLNLVYLFVAIWGCSFKASRDIPRVDLDLAEKLASYNVNYKGVITSGPLATLVGRFAPALMFFRDGKNQELKR